MQGKCSLSSHRENYAYSLGIQAYIYGYPLVTMERTRQLQSLLEMSSDPAFTASNVFFYELITPDFKDVVSPVSSNNRKFIRVNFEHPM